MFFHYHLKTHNNENDMTTNPSDTLWVPAMYTIFIPTSIHGGMRGGMVYSSFFFTYLQKDKNIT